MDKKWKVIALMIFMFMVMLASTNKSTKEEIRQQTFNIEDYGVGLRELYGEQGEYKLSDGSVMVLKPDTAFNVVERFYGTIQLFDHNDQPVYSQYRQQEPSYFGSSKDEVRRIMSLATKEYRRKKNEYN